jgi:hypothetical protein
MENKRMENSQKSHIFCGKQKNGKQNDTRIKKQIPLHK